MSLYSRTLQNNKTDFLDQSLKLFILFSSITLLIFPEGQIRETFQANRLDHSLHFHLSLYLLLPQDNKLKIMFPDSFFTRSISLSSITLFTTPAEQ